MVQFEDYYQMLGVQRDVSEVDLKKAYRKLAREYHPDRNQSNKEASEAKFKKINEAYSILSDTEKRAQYDRLGRIPHGSEFKPPPGSNYDFNLGGDFSDIFDLLFNNSMSGRSSSSNMNRTVKGDDIQFALSLSLEEAFHGANKKINLGAGGTLEVKIPAGVYDGSKVRLAGRGNPSRFGGPLGDLILNIQLLPNNNFILKDHNLETKLFINLTEAIFGCVQKVKTFTGELDLKIPAGIQSGQKMRLTGQGWVNKAGRGDLFVQILVKTPQNLSEKAKKLFEELKDLGF